MSDNNLNSNIYTVTVEPGQTTEDIALQEYGHVDATYSVCKDNGLDIGTEINPGTDLLINRENVINEDVVNFYKKEKIKPATQLNLD